MVPISSPLRVAVAGSTGLIGSLFMQHALEHPALFELTGLVRRTPTPALEGVRYALVDYAMPETVEAALLNTDAIVCAVGTTQAKVRGNKAAYAAVDLDIPILLSTISGKQQINSMVLVSAVGAHPEAASFYLQLKGKAEQVCQKAGIGSFYILRPSLLLGNRTEVRTGERLAQRILPLFTYLLPSQYRPIRAHIVAKAIAKALLDQHPGTHLWHYWDMMNASQAAI